MGIYLGDKPTALYRGSYKPVNLYSGDKKAAGWKLSEKTGTSLEWADTYNDKVASAVVSGASTQEQTVQGKNLFDWTRAKIVDDSGIEQPSYGTITNGIYVNQMSLYGWIYYITLPIGTIVAGNTYTISFDILVPVSQAIYFGVRNTEGTRTHTYKSVTAGVLTHTHMTVTAPAGYTYFQFIQLQGSTRVDYRNINVVFSNIQLELGTTATAYAPFVPNSPSPDYPSPIHSAGEVSGIDLTVTGNVGQSYTAHRDIILRGLPDGTHDTWDVVTGTVTRNVGVKVFDGTEAFALTGVVGNDIQGFAVKSSALGAALKNATMYCSHFQYAPEAGASSIPNTCSQIDATYGIRFVVSTAIVPNKTTAELSAYVTAQYAAGTPVTVLYKLATPTIEQIDPMALPTYPHYTRVDQDGEVKANLQLNAKVIDR